MYGMVTVIYVATPKKLDKITKKAVKIIYSLSHLVVPQTAPLGGLGNLGVSTAVL